MDDYISREAALKLIDNAPIIAGNENETLISAPKLSDEVYCLPTANVRPVVRASWEWKNTDALASFAWTCSVCGQRKAFKTNFCPNCGADMRPYKDGRRGEKNNG